MENSNQPLVSVIMGSKSDWETMRHADETLTRLGVPHECRIVSAHRTPQWLAEFASTAEARGVQVIIARSFARIFYRNAVNIGLPVLICEEAVVASADGQEIEVDLASGVIRNTTTGQTFQSQALDPFVARIVAAGGIIEYIRQEGTLR